MDLPKLVSKLNTLSTLINMQRRGNPDSTFAQEAREREYWNPQLLQWHTVLEEVIAELTKEANLPRCAPSIMAMPVYMASFRVGSGTDENPTRGGLIITPVFDEFVLAYISYKGHLCSTAIKIDIEVEDLKVVPVQKEDIWKRAYEMEKEWRT